MQLGTVTTSEERKLFKKKSPSAQILLLQLFTNSVILATQAWVLPGWRERILGGRGTWRSQQGGGRWVLGRLEEPSLENEEAWERRLLCKRLLRGPEFKFLSLLGSP